LEYLFATVPHAPVRRKLLSTLRVENSATYGAQGADLVPRLAARPTEQGRGADKLLQREISATPPWHRVLGGPSALGIKTGYVVADERIVYAYEMHLDDRKIYVSLATLELKPAGTDTRLVMTEQGAFLDGYDDAGSREHGSNFLLDALGNSLK
jgi:uncharacterized protein YndB with AHSA1/START domain